MGRKFQCSRRTFIGAGLVSALSGCDAAVVKIGKVVSGQIYQPDMPAEQVNAIPYATMVGHVGHGAPSIVVLGKIEGDKRYWYSADKAVIITRNGRVIQTANFPQNLAHTEFYGRDPLASDAVFGPNPTLRRAVDLMPGNFFGLSILSRFTVDDERETLDLYGRSYTVVKITEKCTTEQKDWSFTNTYWRDVKTGLIRKSVQHYMPSVPPLELAVGRPERL